MKPNVKQIDLIRKISSEIKGWASTIDINSPIHWNLIAKFCECLELTEKEELELNASLNRIMLIIKKTKAMKYNKEKQEIETLSNHKEFYKTIKKICEGDFVLSSSSPMNHICSLQNKINVFIVNEQLMRTGTVNKDQRIRDANFADKWLEKVSLDLIDSGVKW